MKTLVMTIALALAPTAAFADPLDFYFGVAMSSPHYDNGPDFAQGMHDRQTQQLGITTFTQNWQNHSNSFNGGSLTAGAAFGRYIALEGGLEFAGRGEFQIRGNGVPSEVNPKDLLGGHLETANVITRGVSLSLLAGYPIGNWRLYGRGGGFWSQTKVKGVLFRFDGVPRSDPTERLRSSGIGPMWAVGIELGDDDDLVARLEYSLYRSPTALDVNLRTHMLRLGVVIR